MESPSRTIAKAVSWQLLGLLSMTLIGCAFTGSVAAAGSLAIITTIIGAVCYVFHERAWNRIAWGRIDPFHSTTR